MLTETTMKEMKGDLKTMKKLTSLLIVAVMLIVVCMAASAVTIGSDGVASTGGNELTFSKSILMKNANSTNVREPNITYTYTITEPTSLDTDETVTDANNHVGHVYKLSDRGGVLADVLPTQTATAVFSDANVVSTSTVGVETIENVTFTFDESKFPHAGIFRFVVTETSDNTKASVGITENEGYSATMFLDVYVQGQGDHTTIYAYVLFENNDADIADATKAARQKSAGWSGGDTSSSVNQDIYQTYDLEVQKAIDGDETSKSHQFPFVITLTNSTLATKVDVSASATTATITSTLSHDDVGNYITLSSTGTAINAKLSDLGTVTFKGIPSGTTAKVKETNDTYDFYSLSATVTGSTTTDISAVNDTIAPGADSTETPAINIDGSAETRISFGNNLTRISPTGYVSRYAPYGLILVGGIVLMLIAVKRKKHHDEED